MLSDGISIHALVKRATIVINGSWRYPSNFNPRPREEGDSNTLRYIILNGDFNPRPREEGDADTDFFACDLGNFNPRPREEGDD